MRLGLAVKNDEVAEAMAAMSDVPGSQRLNIQLHNRTSSSSVQKTTHEAIQIELRELFFARQAEPCGKLEQATRLVV